MWIVLFKSKGKTKDNNMKIVKTTEFTSDDQLTIIENIAKLIAETLNVESKNVEQEIIEIQLIKQIRS